MGKVKLVQGLTHLHTTPVVSMAVLAVLLVALSGCSTQQNVVTSSNVPHMPVATGSQLASPSHEALNRHTSNTKLMPEIRKASNLGILFHTLEVPAFVHDREVSTHIVESLRQTVMEQMREEHLFDRVVESTTDHENTLILKAHIISWSDDAIEISLAVDTRCGCRLGEALGKGTTQVTELNADSARRASTDAYDLNPVAQGAVQYVADVMGAKAG